MCTRGTDFIGEEVRVRINDQIEVVDIKVQTHGLVAIIEDWMEEIESVYIPSTSVSEWVSVQDDLPALLKLAVLRTHNRKHQDRIDFCPIEETVWEEKECCKINNCSSSGSCGGSCLSRG